MNRDDIIRMAEESTPDQMIGGFEFDYEQILHFANLVAAAERERILDMCKEGLWDGEGIKFHLEKQGGDQ